MNKKQICSILVLVLCVSFAATLCAQSASNGAGTEPVLKTPHPRYELQAGDTIEITFRYTPEFDQTVSVQPDGYISLRDLPDMYVAGQTSPKLVENLTKAYAKTLHEPVITVSIKDFEKPYFIVGGEVGHP